MVTAGSDVFGRKRSTRRESEKVNNMFMDHISKSILRYRTFLINRHEIISCYCSFTSSVLARFNSTGRNSFLIYWCGFTAKFWNFEIFIIFSGKIHWLNRFFRTLSPKCSTKWQIWAKYLNYAPLQYLCYYTHSFFLMWGWSVWMFSGVISLLREIHFMFEILRAYECFGRSAYFLQYVYKSLTGSWNPTLLRRSWGPSGQIEQRAINWWWIFLVVWLSYEMRFALYREWTIVRDPIHREFSAPRKQGDKNWESATAPIVSDPNLIAMSRVNNFFFSLKKQANKDC